MGVLCETQRNCETPAELCPDFSKTRINVNQKPQPKYCQIMGNAPKQRVFLNIFPCFVAYGMGIGILSNKQRNRDSVLWTLYMTFSTRWSYCIRLSCLNGKGMSRTTQQTISQQMLTTQLQGYGLISRSQPNWNSCWATVGCKASQDRSPLDQRGSQRSRAVRKKTVSRKVWKPSDSSI